MSYQPGKSADQTTSVDRGSYIPLILQCSLRYVVTQRCKSWCENCKWSPTKDSNLFLPARSAVCRPNRSCRYQSVSFMGKIGRSNGSSALESGEPQCSPSRGHTMPSSVASTQTNCLVRDQFKFKVSLRRSTGTSLPHAASWLL